MLKKWICKWLGIPILKVDPYIPEQQKDEGNGHFKVIDWYDPYQKAWTVKKMSHQEWEDIRPNAVARWCIKQFITCPFCNWDTDIIAANLKAKASQGRVQAKDIAIVKQSDGSSRTQLSDTMVDIPTPPYFGAAWEDTDGLDEHIACDKCGKDLTVNEVHWQYGE